jgi:protein-L-isoaspartate(D-aspartate) O-methyltransferase
LLDLDTPWSRNEQRYRPIQHDRTANPSLGSIRWRSFVAVIRGEARLLQDADVKRTDKVLEVGTGSGYMAALLAHQAASVLSFELDATLAQQARTNLQAAGIHNVEVRQADGSQGAPSDGPFDVIMLSGSVPNVPQVLLNQLSIGGRLLAVVGEDPVMRASVITRTADQQWQTSEPWDTMAPRLQGFPEHNRFSF